MHSKSNKISSFVKKNRTKIAITAISLFLIATTLFVTASATETVKIIHNGKEYEISTMKKDADEIIKKSGIEFNEKTSFIDTTRFEDEGIIVIDDMCSVTVVDGKKKKEVIVHGTAADAVAEAGFEMGEYDELEGMKPEDNLEDGMEIKINRAVSVSISADGDITTVYVVKGSTIKDALDKAVITADDDDIISKPLDKVIKSDTAVKITRVSVVERTETETVKYKTVKKKTNSLASGKTKIKQKGVNGSQTAVYEDKYVDGELVESNLKSTKIIKKPVECIKLVGTKASAVSANAHAAGSKGGVKLASGVRTISVFNPPASLELDKNNIPTSYKRKLTGSATAYYGGTHTATGATVKPGIVAVNPRQIPYHTAMWIVSNDGKFVYGYSFAEDTGGFVNFTGARTTLCDLYMPSLADCYSFGRRNVTIYIL